MASETGTPHISGTEEDEVKSLQRLAGEIECLKKTHDGERGLAEGCQGFENSVRDRIGHILRT